MDNPSGSGNNRQFASNTFYESPQDDRVENGNYLNTSMRPGTLPCTNSGDSEQANSEIGYCLVCRVYMNNVANHMQSHSKDEMIAAFLSNDTQSNQQPVQSQISYPVANGSISGQSANVGYNQLNSYMGSSSQMFASNTQGQFNYIQEQSSGFNSMNPMMTYSNFKMESPSVLESNTEPLINSLPSTSEPKIMQDSLSTQPILRPFLVPNKNIIVQQQPDASMQNVPLMISPLNPTLAVNQAHLQPRTPQPISFLVLNNNKQPVPQSSMFLNSNQNTFQRPHQVTPDIKVQNQPNIQQFNPRLTFPNLLQKNSSQASPKIVFLGNGVLTKNNKVVFNNPQQTQQPSNCLPTNHNTQSSNKTSHASSGGSSHSAPQGAGSSVASTSSGKSPHTTVQVGSNITISVPKDMANKRERLQQIINEELVRGIILNDSKNNEADASLNDISHASSDVKEIELAEEDLDTTENQSVSENIGIAETSYFNKFPETEYINIKEEECSSTAQSTKINKPSAQRHEIFLQDEPGPSKQLTTFTNAIQTCDPGTSSPRVRSNRLQESTFPSGSSSFKVVEMTQDCEMSQSSVEVKVKPDYLVPEEQILFTSSSFFSDGGSVSAEENCVLIDAEDNSSCPSITSVVRKSLSRNLSNSSNSNGRQGEEDLMSLRAAETLSDSDSEPVPSAEENIEPACSPYLQSDENNKHDYLTQFTSGMNAAVDDFTPVIPSVASSSKNISTNVSDIVTRRKNILAQVRIGRPGRSDNFDEIDVARTKPNAVFKFELSEPSDECQTNIADPCTSIQQSTLNLDPQCSTSQSLSFSSFFHSNAVDPDQSELDLYNNPEEASEIDISLETGSIVFGPSDSSDKGKRKRKSKKSRMEPEEYELMSPPRVQFSPPRVQFSPQPSTSGLNSRKFKSPCHAEQDYDLEYDSDWYADSDSEFFNQVRSTNFILDQWKCNVCNIVFKSLKEKLLHAGKHSPKIIKEFKKSSKGSKKKSSDKVQNEEVQADVKVFSNLLPTVKLENVKTEKTKDCDDDIEMDDPNLIEQQRNFVKQNEFKFMVDRNTKREALDQNKCPECLESFNTYEEVQSHRRSALRNKYACPFCHEKFGKVSEKHKHLKTHHKTDVITCPVCYMTYKNLNNYCRHQLQHLGVIFFECKDCGKKFSKKCVYLKHKQTHGTEKPYSCHECFKNFATLAYLQRHLYTHMDHQKQTCDVCNKEYKNSRTLLKHKRDVHGTSSKIRIVKDYLCSFENCGKIFATAKKLAWHKETHQRWPKRCVFCQERFIHESNLVKHIRMKHDSQYLKDKQGNNSCPICKKVFLKSSLTLHMRIHENVKPFKCGMCNRSFRVKCNLEAHMYVHSGKRDRPHKCTLCPRSFCREKDLQSHIRSHKNIRPFICNECGKSFIYKNNLVVHMKKHSGKKEHKCLYCDKSFYRKYNLQNHERIHTGELPYTCGICFKKFTQKSNYNVHKKSFHVERHAVREEMF